MNKKAMESEEDGWEGSRVCCFFVVIICLGLDTNMSLMHST